MPVGTRQRTRLFHSVRVCVVTSLYRIHDSQALCRCSRLCGDIVVHHESLNQVRQVRAGGDPPSADPHLGAFQPQVLCIQAMMKRCPNGLPFLSVDSLFCRCKLQTVITCMYSGTANTRQYDRPTDVHKSFAVLQPMSWVYAPNK